MRAALALLCLLAVGFVAATETSVAAQDYSEVVSDEENMSLEDAENAPFVPNQSESDADEVADETAADEEESMVSDEESDAADELEGNTEFALEDGETAEAAEFSFAETDANANVETDAEKLPKKLAKVLKAPRALKKKQHRRHHRRHHRGAAFKFHPERLIQADTLKGEDPEMAKLNLALAAVKEDILSTNKQITDERKWVIAVAKIIASYNNKMKRVEGHIIALRKEMKSLYRKKKQIENLKLQKALEAKLKEATNELATLSSSLKHVAVKSNELNRSGSDLRATIAGIQAQLRKLRGQSIKKSRKPKAAVRGRKAGRKHGRKGGKKCGKGKRYSRKAKRCVPRKAKAFAVKKH